MTFMLCINRDYESLDFVQINGRLIRGQSNVLIEHKIIQNKSVQLLLLVINIAG